MHITSSATYRRKKSESCTASETANHTHMPKKYTPQIHSCTECKHIRCLYTETTLCYHPRHIRHLPNLRRAEKCFNFEKRTTTNKENEESDLS